MMNGTKSLTTAVATLYAELHDLTAMDASTERGRGSFVAKTIHGKRYWYSQKWVGKKRVQRSLGPETPELVDRIARLKQQLRDRRIEASRRRELCRALRAALNMTTDALSGAVIRQIADAGIFGAGAVLIGTHAFMTYPAMLGHRFARSATRTSDIDFAAVDVAAAEAAVSFSEAVRAVHDEFFVVPPRPGSRISTALKYRGAEARVELLTPLSTGRPWTPKVIASMAFGAQQVPFLDYLIEKPVPATYLFDDGVRVTVPDPARFALHKLIVAENRDISARAKAAKDVDQAAQLIATLSDIDGRTLDKAARALAAAGSSYLTKARRGAARLPEDVKILLPKALRDTGTASAGKR
ncbi:MAG TPA: GSU2403 family nucleotidyltransferase fold protein [Alphaproteobacteria bacterium]|jgi:hypothetical protein|nr:GSU2403 family nucleotidyltransferase fold protein [Alphaproteobacteria bacterium]